MLLLQTLLEFELRFPLMGSWKTDFKIGREWGVRSWGLTGGGMGRAGGDQGAVQD